MFSENKKDKQTYDTTSNQNVIAQGTQFVGDLTSEGGFRIDGKVEGNVKTPGKIVVGKSGFIKGTLEGTDAYFEGKFSGKLLLSGTLTLKDSAHIEGEVVVGKLSVEPGATFNVTCSMKGAVKEFKQSTQEASERKQTGQGQSA
ncbi:MAG TPA: polymer-forming cytoskeletal protein [Flavobacteriaceae bacterium]|nr:polymer-forming cytoskeletal protein [Flavobacteriaceae bacterium]